MQNSKFAPSISNNIDINNNIEKLLNSENNTGFHTFFVFNQNEKTSKNNTLNLKLLRYKDVASCFSLAKKLSVFIAFILCFNALAMANTATVTQSESILLDDITDAIAAIGGFNNWNGILVFTENNFRFYNELRV